MKNATSPGASWTSVGIPSLPVAQAVFQLLNVDEQLMVIGGRVRMDIIYLPFISFQGCHDNFLHSLCMAHE
jgi:hypothetical protein